MSGGNGDDALLRHVDANAGSLHTTAADDAAHRLPRLVACVGGSVSTMKRANTGTAALPAASAAVTVTATSPSLGMTDGGFPLCPLPCSGDVDGSRSIDGVDLAIVLQNWGAPSAKYPGADINADGEVNGSDLAIVLAGWGACP